MDSLSVELRSDSPHVVFQECPNEVALCFSIYGCPLRCDGCHSEELWNKQGGQSLDESSFSAYLNQYQGLITAVVFFGGEWQPKALRQLLILAQSHQLKTCLYTGLNHVSRHLRPHLDFVKTGPWRKDLGGLTNHQSNQRFYRLEHGQLAEDLTYLFQTDSAQTHADAFEHTYKNQTYNNQNTREPQHAAA